RMARWLDVARRKVGPRAFEADRLAGEALSDGEAIAAARRFVTDAERSTAAEVAAAPRCDSLTDRQREVAALVARGLTNSEIAQELVVSPATARAHVEHVLDRLGLHCRAQIAAWFAQHCSNPSSRG